MMTGEECAQVPIDMGLCGCMENGSIMGWVKSVLTLVAKRQAPTWTTDADQKQLDALMGYDKADEASWDNPTYWLMWAALDRAKLIEHGGNVMGSWLTPKGRDFLAALDTPPLGWNPEDPMSWDIDKNGVMQQFAGLSETQKGGQE